MLFGQIKTEKDIDFLKRKIVKDKALFARILKIRKNMLFTKGKPLDIKRFPTHAEVLALYREMVKKGEEKKSELAEFFLRKIKTKSNSGIVAVSLLTKPFSCPGRCLYCPTEKNMPKSYLAKEPAAARALSQNFNPYKQIIGRLKALEVNGHSLDKIEIIVIGGTWSHYPSDYQEKFISEIFRACNNFYRKTKIKKNEKSFSQLKKINEKAKCRIIGMSVETRPDHINLKEIKKLREFGVTKVEMGVQHLDDKILDLNKRDILTEKVAEATEILRRNGIKVVYHMMLNLYGSSPKKDIAMFEKLFSDKRFYPDMLKIYPCVLLKNTALYKVWKKDGFKLYTDNQLKNILIAIKKKFPPFVRVIRVIRDIPAEYIIAGSKMSNMRQKLSEDQNKNNWRCKCIRCREVREEEVNLKNIKLKKVVYKVVGGVENFLSYEDKKNDRLVAFLRLFLADDFDKNKTLLVLNDCAIIRELHTYGRLVSLSKKGEQGQHRGFGKSLLEEAEKLAKKAGFSKIAVIAGIGAREYYKKLGYKLKGTYVVKYLT